jgi:hypothetical protein
MKRPGNRPNADRHRSPVAYKGRGASTWRCVGGPRDRTGSVDPHHGPRAPGPSPPWPRTITRARLECSGPARREGATTTRMMRPNKEGPVPLVRGICLFYPRAVFSHGRIDEGEENVFRTSTIDR